jgi:hypothetical protein
VYPSPKPAALRHHLEPPSRGVQVLIDGAHALGQLPLDLRGGVCGGSCGQEDEPTAEDGASLPGAAPGRGTEGDVGGTKPEGGSQEAVEVAEAEARTAPVWAAGISSSSGGGGAGAGAGGNAHEGDLEKKDRGGEEHSDLCVPDYFVTNCHKWLCAPRGSALLWVAPRRQPCVRPLVVSHGSGCGFTSDFIWDGKGRTCAGGAWCAPHTRQSCLPFFLAYRQCERSLMRARVRVRYALNLHWASSVFH